ncbi:MAG: GNAT family N-acetyltransferase [Trueperaceae bacterium]|nr:GNAT family N-acetyltransferase [Trueperaceae bacterium]
MPLQKDISCLLRDQSDAIVAGVYASVWGNVCNIKGLWVHEAHRRKGLGKQLLELVEQEALAYGCTLLTIFPYSFQEPKFYQLQGFEFAGVIEDSPFPHKLYFLQKNLASQ